MTRSAERGGTPVRVFRRGLTLRSEAHVQVIDVTTLVRDVVLGTGVNDGVALVNALHTTCALFVNEFQGALVADLTEMMEELVPEHGGYRHDDSRYSDCERGNACAHLRASLLGRSLAVGISGGALSLGRFQSILLAELDGPRSRSLDVHVLGV